MKHALAWIEVNIKADQADVLKVNTLTLTDIVERATMKVSYATVDSPVLSWESTVEDDRELFATATTIGTSYTTVEFLIIPADEQTTLEMGYDLGTNTGKTWSEDLTGEWKAGYKYVYNIEVGASEIKIAPTVDTWNTTEPAEDFSVEQ